VISVSLVQRTSLGRACEVTFLFVGLYYLSYRYPFQIGSSTTSYGYADTPLVLQVGKYLLLLAALLPYVTLSSKRIKAVPGVLFVYSGCVYLAVAGGVCAVLTGYAGAAESALLWMMAAHMAIRRDERGVQPYLGFLTWFSVIALAFVCLQIVLFFSTGRVPGLSISGSIFIRFGGLWDDPNGFAIALSLIVPLCFLRIRSGLFRFLFSAFSLLCLLATQSLTGIGAFFVSMLLGLMLLVLFGAIRPGVLLVILLLAASAVISAVFIFYERLEMFLEMKSGSVADHLRSLNALSEAGWPAFFGLEPNNSWTESAYVNWLVNYGVAYTAVNFALLGFMILASAALCIRRREFIPVMFFLIAYAAGLANLPLDAVFPVNLLAMFLGAIVLRTYFASHEQVLRSPA
jgi:hypothetical protein